MEAPEILRDAAARLADGWCRGAYEQDGKLCSMGAMFAAYYGNARIFERELPSVDELSSPLAAACRELAAVLAEQFDADHPLAPTELSGVDATFAIAAANDKYARDAAEMIACMEKAAANIEEKTQE